MAEGVEFWLVVVAFAFILEAEGVLGKGISMLLRQCAIYTIASNEGLDLPRTRVIALTALAIANWIWMMARLVEAFPLVGLLLAMLRVFLVVHDAADLVWISLQGPDTPWPSKKILWGIDN